MAAPMVTSKVILCSGVKREFSHSIQNSHGKITHEKLRESVQLIQKEVNDFLTVQVDLEKGSNQQNNLRRDDDSQGEELEGDEDETNGHNEKGQVDADKEQRPQEPPKKKPKK